jgi:hypothetical protein
MNDKINFLFLALFALSASAKQNVVFILADDMSRDTWGAYGGQDCKTPNIDQLAKDGIRFDRAYCTVAMCAPFRQELYTGRSPWRNRDSPKSFQISFRNQKYRTLLKTTRLPGCFTRQIPCRTK